MREVKPTFLTTILALAATYFAYQLTDGVEFVNRVLVMVGAFIVAAVLGPSKATKHLR